MGIIEKSIILRYCQVVKHNVVLELDGNPEKQNKKSENLTCCLNSQKCLNDRGGCTNKILNLN